jgi:vitamin B12 transporter
VAAGNGFKAPTFSELFARSAFEVGNPGLRPERSRSLEAGLAMTAGNATLGLTAFDQQYRDLVQYVSAAPGEPTYANLGAAISRGVEVTAHWQPTPGLTVEGQWTILRTAVTDTGAASSATFAEGQRLLRRPAQTLAVVLVARPGRTIASLGLFWTGERDDADFGAFPAARVTLPAYLLVNGALSLPLASPAGAWPGLAVQVRGENLLDQEYEQVVGFPGRGRTMLAGGRLFW